MERPAHSWFSTIVTLATLAGVAAGGWTYLGAGGVPSGSRGGSARQPESAPTPTLLAAAMWSARDWEGACGAYAALAAEEADNATFAFRHAYCLHLLGRYEEAVPAHERAAAFAGFRAVALYNLGCAQARLGNTDEAFAAIERAIGAGFGQLDQIEGDPDLHSLRDDARWAPMLDALGAPPAEAAGHALAFWVGSWEVRTPEGQRLGSNSLTLEQNGMVVREVWTGADGSVGTSLNFLDPASDQWRQVWVDGMGNVLDIAGPVAGDGSLTMTGEMTRPTGPTTPMRMILTPMPDGRVRQVFETSADDGQTWSVGFEGIYSKPEANPDV